MGTTIAQVYKRLEKERQKKHPLIAAISAALKQLTSGLNFRVLPIQHHR